MQSDVGNNLSNALSCKMSKRLVKLEYIEKIYPFIDLGNITNIPGKNMYEKISYKFNVIDESIKLRINGRKISGVFIYDGNKYGFDCIYEDGYVYVQGYSAKGVNNFKLTCVNGSSPNVYSVNT